MTLNKDLNVIEFIYRIFSAFTKMLVNKIECKKLEKGRMQNKALVFSAPAPRHLAVFAREF